MINLFTQEYIELAKNSKVQGLREWNDNGIELLVAKFGDIFYLTLPVYEGALWFVKSEEENMDAINIWLPTGDQLDEEIVKICDKNSYTYHINYISDEDTEWIVYINGEDDDRYIPQVNNTNPLIAKISLLIQLLEGE